MVKTKNEITNDVRESLREELDFLAGKKTGAIVHRVYPSEAKAQNARLTLGLSKAKRVADVGPDRIR